MMEMMRTAHKTIKLEAALRISHPVSVQTTVYSTFLWQSYTGETKRFGASYRTVQSYDHTERDAVALTKYDNEKRLLLTVTQSDRMCTKMRNIQVCLLCDSLCRIHI